VEHLLAAVAGMELDNLKVELDGPEVPIADGSCSAFVELLTAAGFRLQGRPRWEAAPTRPLRVEQDHSRIDVYPAEETSLECRVDLSGAGRGIQIFSWHRGKSFPRELAPARTFGFLEEAAVLLEQGLIRGTALDNTVVLSGAAAISCGGLRFSDEFARHKTLDLLGDLFLLGGPLRARVVAARPGHALNHRIVRIIKEEIRS